MQEAVEYVMFYFYHFVTKTNRYMNRYKQNIHHLKLCSDYRYKRLLGCLLRSRGARQRFETLIRWIH